MKPLILPITGILAALACHASGAITITSSTASWTPISYVNPTQADPNNDQQTGGREGDIVGDASNASFYTAFDNGGTTGNLTDGEIGFRVRLAGDASPDGLKTVVWIGIDANADGKVDLFAGALEDAKIGFYPAGASANISPNTTSINSSLPYFETATTAANFNFSPINAALDPAATSFNLDGGSGGGANHTDHFVSFKFSLGSLVTAVNGLNLPGVSSFNENSPLRYIVATSQQDNALNMDLNGINGGINSTTTWEALGGFTKATTPSGVAVPEPSSLALVSIASLLLGIRRRTPSSQA
jgi:hypothetical protein